MGDIARSIYFTVILDCGPGLSHTTDMDANKTNENLKVVDYFNGGVIDAGPLSREDAERVQDEHASAFYASNTSNTQCCTQIVPVEATYTWDQRRNAFRWW